MPSALVEPAYFTHPDYHRTFADEVHDLAALARFEPDPEQDLVLEPMFGVDRRGKSVAFEVCVIGSRQNIKTGLMKIAALGKTLVMERPLFVWSAHEFRTSQESFRDLVLLIESTPDLDRMVKKISRANGDEGIEWLGGQRIIFKARTNSGGRGLTGDDVGLDEGFALTPEHMGALLPTLSARPDPQVFYGSSAGQVESDVLRGIRDRGRGGTSSRLIYVEWCAPPAAQACDAGDECTHLIGTPGCGFDKFEIVQRANPQLGRRISWDYVCAERQALPVMEFARERMGWWDEADVILSAFRPGQWAGCRDVDSEIDGRPALSFEVRADRTAAYIVAAGQRADGLSHGELVPWELGGDVFAGPGTAWLLARVRDVYDRNNACVLAIDAGGPAGAFLQALTAEAGGFAEVKAPDDPVPDGKRRLLLITPREYAQACGALANDVVNGQFRHVGQGPLDDSVEHARTKELAGSFKWISDDTDTDMRPLIGLTIARHGFAVFGNAPTFEPFALLG